MPVTAVLQQFVFNNHRIEIFIPHSNTIKDIYKQGDSDLTSPYWAKVWPSAIGLCEFLLEQLHYIKDKKVLELAAGLGIPGIVAAPYASEVCSSDIEPLAVNLFLQSVRHNKLNNVTARVIDWNELQGIPVPDTLLLSDINYEPAQFEKLFAAIGYFLDRHCTIILSTPQRLVARDFINQLLPFCKEQAVRTIATESGTTEISIFVLKQ